MKYLFQSSAVLLVVLFSVTSCSIQKRVYRKGYHVVSNNKKVNETKKGGENKVKETTLLNEVPEVVIVSVKTDIENEFIPLKKNTTFILGKDTCGDVMLLKSGDKISVKVIEVEKDQIRYKRCDNMDGPIFTVHKRSIAMLQYYNGVKENLDVEEDVKQTPVTPQEKRKINNLGLASFIFGILSVLFGITLILSVPFALGSLAQFRKNPDKYKDRWMAMAGTIISFIVALLLTLLFLLTFIEGGFGLGFTIYFGILTIVSLIGLIEFN